MGKIKTYKVGKKESKKEFKVEFSMLKPSKSLIFLMYMGKMIGGSAGKVIGAFKGDSLDSLMDMKEENLNLESMGNAIVSVIDRIDEKEVLEKINLLFESVTINGEVLDIDHMMFDGRPDLIFKVAKEAMEANFKDFLLENSEVFTKIIKSLRIVKSGTKSQKEPT